MRVQLCHVYTMKEEDKRLRKSRESLWNQVTLICTVCQVERAAVCVLWVNRKPRKERRAAKNRIIPHLSIDGNEWSKALTLTVIWIMSKGNIKSKDYHHNFFLLFKHQKLCPILVQQKSREVFPFYLGFFWTSHALLQTLWFENCQFYQKSLFTWEYTFKVNEHFYGGYCELGAFFIH